MKIISGKTVLAIFGASLLAACGAGGDDTSADDDSAMASDAATAEAGEDAASDSLADDGSQGKDTGVGGNGGN